VNRRKKSTAKEAGDAENVKLSANAVGDLDAEAGLASTLKAAERNEAVLGAQEPVGEKER